MHHPTDTSPYSVSTEIFLGTETDLSMQGDGNPSTFENWFWSLKALMELEKLEALVLGTWCRETKVLVTGADQ